MKNKKDDELLNWLNGKEEEEDFPLGAVLLIVTTLTIVNLTMFDDVPGELRGAMVAFNAVLFILALCD